MNRLAQVNRFCATPVPVTALVLLGSTARAEEWSLDRALKQIEKATEGIRGISGEVNVTDEPDKDLFKPKWPKGTMKVKD